jgi:hypothetical protein
MLKCQSLGFNSTANAEIYVIRRSVFEPEPESGSCSSDVLPCSLIPKVKKNNTKVFAHYVEVRNTPEYPNFQAGAGQQ